MNENTVTKTIGDLGISAYVLMNNFKLAGKRDRSFAFFVPNDRSDEFNRLKFNYLFSEFHYFDHCLMGLKKLEDYVSNSLDPMQVSVVNDLGVAAYLLMHKFKIIAKKGKIFYFETHSSAEKQQFEELGWQYASSEYHEFDSKLMSLKKINDNLSR
jgi:hypothetical protein